MSEREDRAEVRAEEAEAKTADIVITLEQYERERNRRIFQALIGLVALVALVSFNLWYTSYSQNRADARWCSIVSTLDDRNKSLTPQQRADPRIMKYVQDMSRLRRDLHC